MTDGAAEKKGISCLGLAGMVIVGSLALGTCVAFFGDPPPSAAPDAPRVPSMQVTAIELFRAYAANEARAQEVYGDRVLEVTGTVDGVDLDLTNDPVVLLRTDNQFMPAHAELAEIAKSRASDLNRGDQIVLICEDVQEAIGRPMLRDCTFPPAIGSDAP